jgi:HD-like signal output (HDOD) protein
VEFLRRMLAKIEAGTVELPAFPQVVIQVQEVLKNPNYSVQMIASPISADPTRQPTAQYGQLDRIQRNWQGDH